MQYLPAESHLKIAEKCLLDNTNSQHTRQRVQPKRYLPNPNGTHAENSWEETCIHNYLYRSRKRNNCWCSSIISWICFLFLPSLLEGSYRWVKKEWDEPVCSVHTHLCLLWCHQTQKGKFPYSTGFQAVLGLSIYAKSSWRHRSKSNMFIKNCQVTSFLIPFVLPSPHSPGVCD